jgi:SAM-dependent methyltransferase
MAEGAGRREARVVVADVRALPFRAGSADLVTALGVSEYVPDQSRLWREISRVLCPGGHAVVTISPRSGLNRVRRVWGMPLYLRTPGEVGTEWDGAGLQFLEGKSTTLQWIALLRKPATPNPTQGGRNVVPRVSTKAEEP